jgi:hypothetical protein
MLDYVGVKLPQAHVPFYRSISIPQYLHNSHGIIQTLVVEIIDDLDEKLVQWNHSEYV